MSVKVMSWVWEHSRSKKTERLVLLAIADCASEDGSNAYPSTAELMRKTGLSERGVQGAIGSLVTLGELFVSRNGGPRGCNRYRVIMATPQDLPPQMVPPANGAGADPAGGARDAGADDAPPQETTPDPADLAPGTVLEPSEKNSSSKSSSRGRRGSRLPEPFDISDEMREWVRKECPDVRLPEHERFCDYWRGAPGQRGVKRDWEATWRNWMRKAQDDIEHRRQRTDGHKPSTTDQRVTAALALKQQFREQRSIGT